MQTVQRCVAGITSWATARALRCPLPARPARARALAAHASSGPVDASPPNLHDMQLADARSCEDLAALLPRLPGHWKGPALCRAAGLGCAAEVAQLLEQGAPPDARDAQQRTPLLLAIAGPGGPHVEVVRQLLQHSADATLADRSGSAPLHAAAAAGSAELVQLLLDAGASPDQPDALNRRPSMLAVLRGHGSGDVIRRLSAAGASMSATCAYGHTPLVRRMAWDRGLAPEASQARNPEAHAARQPSHHNPPAPQILAGAMGDAAAVAQLLELGSDPFVVDSKGLTPRAAAEARSAKKVLPDEADELADVGPGEPGGPDFDRVVRLLEEAERERRQHGSAAA